MLPGRNHPQVWNGRTHGLHLNSLVQLLVLTVTCMAGLGEVCPHIAAVLFLMEAIMHLTPMLVASTRHAECTHMHQLQRLTLLLRHEKDERCLESSLRVVRRLYVKVPLVFYSLIKSLKSSTKLHSKKNIWHLHTQILYINVTNVSALCTVGTK